LQADAYQISIGQETIASSTGSRLGRLVREQAGQVFDQLRRLVESRKREPQHTGRRELGSFVVRYDLQ
jgi:hypothetical protein